MKKFMKAKLFLILIVLLFLAGCRRGGGYGYPGPWGYPYDSYPCDSYGYDLDGCDPYGYGSGAIGAGFQDVQLQIELAEVQNRQTYRPW